MLILQNTWDMKGQKIFEIKALGHVTDLNIAGYSIEGCANLKAQLLHLAGMNSPLRVVFTPYDPEKEEEEKRSKAQNRYYHLLLDIICDHTGDEHMTMHEQLKIELLGRPYVLKDKEVIVVKSTKELTLKEFGDYLEKVFKFASEEFGLHLPAPKHYEYGK